jgi:hypothetical protein
MSSITKLLLTALALGVNASPLVDGSFEVGTPLLEENLSTREAAPEVVDHAELDTRATTLTLDQSVGLKVQNNGRQSLSEVLLVWDDTLTAHAQQWANYLAQIDQLQHSTSAQRPGEGENLAWAW